jgi:hypothetical protein
MKKEAERIEIIRKLGLKPRPFRSVYLAKIGNLQLIWSRKLPSEPSSVTVIKDCANRYFLSIGNRHDTSTSLSAAL